jgi:hypothetical protein
MKPITPHMQALPGGQVLVEQVEQVATAAEVTMLLGSVAKVAPLMAGMVVPVAWVEQVVQVIQVEQVALAEVVVRVVMDMVGSLMVCLVLVAHPEARDRRYRKWQIGE